MLSPISFENANPLLARRFLKVICSISNSYNEKRQFLEKEGIDTKKYEGTYTQIESALRARIQQLEEDLLKISEERDSALEENRARINELHEQLFSIRDEVRNIIKSKVEKEKRVRQLEEKISKCIPKF